MTHAPPSERMDKRRGRLIERDGWVHAFNWQNRSIQPHEAPRQARGASRSFITIDSAIHDHRSQHRGVYAGPTTFPAIEQPIASRPDDSLVLMGQQHFIGVALDRCGNLVLRQNGYRRGHSPHELRISRDYLPRFLEALDELRHLIVDAIRRDEAL
jgi:hypothetical protein